MKRNKQIFGLFITLTLLSGFLFSCNDELEDPRAIVKVVYKQWVDTSFVDIPIMNARVRFAPEFVSAPDFTKYVDYPELTDIKGEVEFVTQHEAIIDLIAEGEIQVNDTTIITYQGKGVILLQYDEVYYETIILE